MRRRAVMAVLLTGVVVLSLAQAAHAAREAVLRLQSARLDAQAPLLRIAFGSCFRDNRPGHEVWSAIAATGPQLFIFAGDTLYPDVESDNPALPSLRAAYDALAANREFADLREVVPVLPVWDDHDYGTNDGGADFAARRESEALFEDRWALTERDPRRARDGIYHSVSVGPPGRRAQLVVLDTRFFRSPLRRTERRGTPGAERYLPDPDPQKTLLGEEQWRWLEAQLAEPADLRILVSTIQVLADGHGWEAWRLMPHEQERLFALLAAADDTPTLLLSGDRHVAGFYQRDVGARAPLLEFTSSALNNPIASAYRGRTLGEAGPHRLGELYGEPNFGILDIDWERASVALSLRDALGRSVRKLRWTFDGAVSEAKADPWERAGALHLHY